MLSGGSGHASVTYAHRMEKETFLQDSYPRKHTHSQEIHAFGRAPRSLRHAADLLKAPLTHPTPPSSTHVSIEAVSHITVSTTPSGVNTAIDSTYIYIYI